MNVTNVLAKGAKVISANKSSIKTVSGIIMMLGGSLESAKVSWAMAKKNYPSGTKAGTIIKENWMGLGKTVILDAAGAGLVLSGHHDSIKAIGALAGALSLTEGKLTNLQAAVNDVLSDEKRKQVEEDRVKKEIAANPPNKALIPHVGRGDKLFRFDLTGDYFYADWREVEHAITLFNAKKYGQERYLPFDMYGSLTDLRDEIGLPQIGLGDVLAFDSNIDIRPTVETIETPDGDICFNLCLSPGPKSYT